MVMTTVYRYLVVENLDGLGDDAAGNDSVGGGNGRDDVARHGLHLEPDRRKILVIQLID